MIAKRPITRAHPYHVDDLTDLWGEPCFRAICDQPTCGYESPTYGVDTITTAAAARGYAHAAAGTHQRKPRNRLSDQ